MATLGSLIVNIGANLGGLQKGLKKTEGLVDKAKSKFSALGAAIKTGLAVGAAAGVVAISAAATASLGAFAPFEKGMNEVFTLLPGISGQAMEQMTDQALDFSKEFGVLPEKTVPALYQAISAGVPQDNVFSFLETAQKAAVGGVTELETAVDGISSVVNAYGADVVDATKASDLMFTAVKLGKTNFEELSQNLFNVIPTAASLGVEFGDVTAALAAMTAQGTPTSVATTQMRQLLVELSKSGGKTAMMFEELSGQSFKDFVAGGGNVQQALQLMEQAAAANGVSLSDLFGSVEAGNAALALTGKGTETFTRNLEEMANSAGATDAAYATMDQGLSRTIEKLKVFGNTVLLKVGQALSPVADKILDLAMNALPSVEAGLDNVFGVIEKVQGAFERFGARGAAVSLLGQLGLEPEQIASVMGVADQVADAIGKIQGAFERFGARGAAVSILGQLGLGPEQIATVMGVFDQLTALFSGQLPASMAIFGATIERLQAGFQMFLAALQPIIPIWQQFVASLQPALPGLQTLGMIIGGVLVAAILLLMEAVASSLPTIGAILTAIVGSATSLLTGLITFVAGTVEMFVGLFTGDLARARAGAAQVLEGLVTAIVGPITYLGSVIVSIFKQGIDGAIAVWQYLYNTLVGHSIIPDMVAAIIAAVTGLVTPLVNAFYRVRDQVISTVSQFAGKLLETFDEMVSKIKDKFEVDEWLEIGKNIVLGIRDGINKNASQVFEVIKSMVTSAIEGAKNLLGIHSPSTVAEDEISGNFMLGLIRGIDKRKNSFATKIQETIAGPLGHLQNRLNDFVTQASRHGGLNDIRDEKVIDDIQRAVRKNADKLAIGVAELEAAHQLNQESMQNLILSSTGVAPKVARDLAKSMFKINGEMKQILKELLAGNAELVEAVKEAQAQFNLAKLGLGSGLLQLGTTALDRFSSEAEAAAAQINKTFGKVGDDLPITDAFRELDALTRKWVGSVAPGAAKLTNEEWARLNQLKRLGMEAVGGNRAEYERILQVARELNKVEEQRAELAKQQADLQFMQQQLSLLQTLKDFGINPADIFGGLEFGLDASLPDLIEAVRRAVAAIINTVDDDLQIASPSKVMGKRGRWIVEGLAEQLTRGRSRLAGLMTDLSSSLTGAFEPALKGLSGGSLAVVQAEGSPRQVNEYHLHYNGSAPGDVRRDYSMLAATVGRP